MRIIYISNARLPSEKANSYQSMLQCEAFSRILSVEFWFPFRRNPMESHDIFEFYGVKESFSLRQIPSLDSNMLWRIHHKFGFLVQALSFILFCTSKLLFQRGDFIIYTRDTLATLMAPLLRTFRPSISIFFEDHTCFIKKRSPLRQILLGFFDGVIAINSEISGALTENGIPQERILVAPLGVKPEKFCSLEAREKNVKMKRVLYVGNLFPWKGVYTLAEAAQYLPTNYSVYIVGGSPETLEPFKRYLDETALNSRVILVGHVVPTEVPGYLSNADVLVLPNSAREPISDRFTSPLKLFEYMASGKPIVASNVPALREILRNGKNALLVEADNSRSLADGIQIVCDQPDLARRIGEQARQDVNRYTREARTSSILAFVKHRVSRNGD